MISEIPPHHFTYDLYCASKGFSSGELLTDLDVVQSRHKVIGYAKADNLPVRPRIGQYALMIETECGEKTWCHTNVKPNTGLSVSANSFRKSLTKEGPMGYTKAGD